MLWTGPDPRPRWAQLATRAALTPEESAWLASLPSGAREARLDWVCTTSVERRGHFDKDEQGEVFSDHTTVTGWRPTSDPAVHRAGALSFFGVEAIANGVLSAIPGPDVLGTAITSLTIDGALLFPSALELLGRGRGWEDLSIRAAGWSPAARAAGVRELGANFPRLRGLELQTARLEPADLGALAQAGFLEQLEDLTLCNCALDPEGFSAIARRLGSLVNLDLGEAGLGVGPIGLLAPKLRRARRIRLSKNGFGDEGLRTLIAAGALQSVEDLWLQGCELTDASARALAEASPPRLRGLWLDSNLLTDAGVEALVRAPLFQKLEGLSLFQRGLTDRSDALLKDHPLAGAVNSTTRLKGVGSMWFAGR